jgi:hypothetical protein
VKGENTRLDGFLKNEWALPFQIPQTLMKTILLIGCELRIMKKGFERLSDSDITARYNGTSHGIIQHTSLGESSGIQQTNSEDRESEPWHHGRKNSNESSSGSS